jgi:hypothetical protein
VSHSSFAPWRLLALASAALLAMPLLLAPSSGPGQQGTPNRYIGAAKCKNCHADKESGDQYGIWTTEKHSKAFAELASAKAKEYGKARGVEDPQTSEKCLKCHETAFGKPKEELQRTFDPKAGVQCETCHGPGEQHMKARLAGAAEFGDKKPPFVQIPDGEIQKKPDAKTCAVCHNEESPGYKPFCFHKFVGTIRHLNPLKPRTAAEKQALLTCTCDDKCVCKKDSKDGKCTMPPQAGDAKPAVGK